MKMIDLIHLQLPDGDNVNRDTKARARGFVTTLKAPDRRLFMHFMRDCIECLSLLSLKLQERISTVSEMHDALEATKELLQKFHTRYLLLDHVTSNFTSKTKLFLNLNLKYHYL
jgi:hypothetical protein